MGCLYALVVVAPLFIAGHFHDSVDETAPEKASIDELKKLGAVVGILEGPEADKRSRFVAIDRKWKGGDEGLKYVEKIPSVQKLFVMGRTKISEKRLEKLAKARPDITIQRRPDVYLGISPTTAGEVKGILVGRVQIGSPASEAGLTKGDVIKHFEEMPVEDFEELLRWLTSKSPGDEVNLTISRNGELIALKVKLGSWDNVNPR